MPDTPPPRFRSDISVELVKANAQDSDVVWAARVSTAGEMSLEARDEDPERSAGLIRYLMRDRHGSPFEHTSMTFLVSAPIFVFREFMRHRVGWSYNEARGVLPVGTFSSMYASCNARSLMHFLGLRTQREGARFPSFPQREIEMVAEQMESHFARLMPITHAAFESNGRVAP
jgi:thymidylate synthase ThyX